jgi:hypothetical protein
MRSVMKVRKDEKGIFIKQRNDEVRPLIPDSLRHIRGSYKRMLELDIYNRAIPATPDESRISIDAPVKKHHKEGTLMVFITQGDIREIWFIHEMANQEG